MAKIALLTSGGDAPGMNAAIRSVVRAGLYHGFEIYGVQRGYQGLIQNELALFDASSVAGIIQYGGTMLKTARSEAFKTEVGFQQAVANLHQAAIETLVVIGGDGSMAGAQKLSNAGIQTITIPGTIDNDMAGTEYTLGFDTALNTVLDAVNKIRDTAASHERVAIIQVMGRRSGHIALTAGLASGAEVILVPEYAVTMEQVCERLEKTQARGKLYSIVMVAEGYGQAFTIAEEIAKRTTFNPHVTVLGYIQRGGSPSAQDNIIGSQMGALAVDCVVKGEANCLVAWQHGQICTVPYSEVDQYKPVLDKKLYELAHILSL